MDTCTGEGDGEGGEGSEVSNEITMNAQLQAALERAKSGYNSYAASEGTQAACDAKLLAEHIAELEHKLLVWGNCEGVARKEAIARAESAEAEVRILHTLLQALLQGLYDHCIDQGFLDEDSEAVQEIVAALNKEEKP